MAKAPAVVLLNGPNLNMLGTREPGIYGHRTLADIEQACDRHARAIGLSLTCRQSNSEGTLVDWIQEAGGSADGLIINPGAYSHTSIAILDALQAIGRPVIEVHLSNIHKRESFRGKSYVSRVAEGVICGLGPQGYIFALDALAALLIAQEDT